MRLYGFTGNTVCQRNPYPDKLPEKTGNITGKYLLFCERIPFAPLGSGYLLVKSRSRLCTMCFFPYRPMHGPAAAAGLEQDTCNDRDENSFSHMFPG